MEQFIEELDSGEMHARDQWQLELKSKFFPLSQADSSEYVEEFYFFIPNSLQINNFTYNKHQFYNDQTNLIRYKTPSFSFLELLNDKAPLSPLTRILSLSSSEQTPEKQNLLSDELKLLGNVIRSTLRAEIKTLMDGLSLKKSAKELKEFSEHVNHLCTNIQLVRHKLAQAQTQYLKISHDHVFYEQFLYIDEFMSRVVIYYLTGLLDNIRLQQSESLKDCDKELCSIILKEQSIAENYLEAEKFANNKISFTENEQVLYRSSLLNKFVLGALLLHTSRFTLEQKYQHWISGFAAGIAMLIYFSLFVWLGNVFVWNSLPFILFTVLIYILKDRLKDELKNISYTRAFKWFSDFSTVIQSPDKKHDIGIIKESFSFVEERQLSAEIRKARNVDFHEVLEHFKRPETILLYKRAVKINNLRGRQARRYGLNIIFRFNIHRFLRKAGDPLETYYRLDNATEKLQSLKLPKIYHLDLIIRNTTNKQDSPFEIEIKKLRIIIDKNGIKRIEQQKS